VVLAGAVTGGYALGRVWPVVLLSLQVAAAVELVRVVGVHWRRARRSTGGGAAVRARILSAAWALTAAGACLLSLQAQYGNLLLVLPADQLTPARRQAYHVANLPDYAWVGRAVGRDAVVLTEPVAGRALLTYEIRSVAPPWPDPWLPDAKQRAADQAELLAPATTESRRRALLTKYRVDWVLDLHGTYTWADQYAVEVVHPPGPARLLRLGLG
jgi:hypothetical protein